MKKKLFASLLVAASLITTTLPNDSHAANQSFKDVNEKHWAYSSIEQAVKKGYVAGFEDGKFKPSGNVTRAEFAAFLARTFDDQQRVTEPFNDISENHWAKGVIEQGLALGFINAADYKNNLFEPNKPMSREEISKWLANGLAKSNEEYAAAQTVIQSSKYTVLPIAEFHKGGLQKAAYGNVGLVLGTGLMNGFENGSFKPSGNTTRAEVASILIRFDAAKKKQPSQFKGLNELVEVSKTGTNMTSSAPFEYPKLLNGITFKSVIDQPIEYGYIGTMKLHNAIFVSMESYEQAIKNSIYAKMFVDKSTYYAKGHYYVFMNKTFTPSKNNVGILTFNQSSTVGLLLAKDVTETVAKKYGYNFIPSVSYPAEFVKGKEFKFWGANSYKINNGDMDSVSTNKGEFTFFSPKK